MKLRLELDGEFYEVEVVRTPQGLRVACAGDAATLEVLQSGAAARLRWDDRVHTVTIASDDHAEVDGHNVPFSLRSYEPGGELARAGAGAGRPVQAVMPGRLVKVLVRPGQRVQKGEPLFILEAMKMQNELTSPAAGVIAEVRGQEGDVVEAGRVLARLEA